MSNPEVSSTASHFTISQRNVVALREHLSKWTLREIRNAFDSAGISPSDTFDPEPYVRGERLRLAMKYLHAIDLAKRSDVERLLLVFEYVLVRATDIVEAQVGTPGAQDAQADLTYFLPLLRRDGFEFQNGRVIPVARLGAATQEAIPNASQTPGPVPTEPTAVSDAPTAFISYSWDSAEHKLWVRELAKKLRGSGVDVKLDHWELAPGDELPHFMETGVRANTFILIILTPCYKTKSDSRQGGV
jgi:hypothetical protein